MWLNLIKLCMSHLLCQLGSADWLAYASACLGLPLGELICPNIRCSSKGQIMELALAQLALK